MFCQEVGSMYECMFSPAAVQLQSRMCELLTSVLTSVTVKHFKQNVPVWPIVSVCEKIPLDLYVLQLLQSYFPMRKSSEL